MYTEVKPGQWYADRRNKVFKVKSVSKLRAIHSSRMELVVCALWQDHRGAWHQALFNIDQTYSWVPVCAPV